MEKHAVNMDNTIAADMILMSDIPADFILDNSYLSPRLPKTITDDIRIVRGIASGIIVTAK